MGFNLKQFFEDLDYIIDDELLSDIEMLNRLIGSIKQAKEYAEQCGQL